MTRIKRLPDLIALAVALLVVAGCGGSKTATPPPAAAPAPAPAAAPSPAPAQPAAPQGKPILIGASVSQSGSYSGSGKYALEGYQLWEEQVNQRGGLLGRPVKLVIYDDKSDPKTGAQLYEKLISDDKVDLIVGPYSSAVTAATVGVAEKHQMVMLSPEASDTKIFSQGLKYAFQTQTIADKYLEGAFDIAKKAGYKTAVLLYEDTAFPKSVSDAMPALSAKYGIQVLMNKSYPKDATDFSALVTQAKQQNPDVLLGASYLPASMAIMRQARELGLNAKMYAFTVGPSEQEFSNLGKTGEFVFGSTNWDPTLQTKGNKAFFDSYVKKFGHDPEYHSASNFATMEIMEAAVKAVGSLDQNKLADWLSKNELDTVYGHYQVDAKNIQVGFDAFLLQWLNGKKVLVWPENVASQKWAVPAPPWSERP